MIECNDCKEEFKTVTDYRNHRKLDCESSRSPGCYVAVPVAELEKLEQAREQLYEFLAGRISEGEMLGLVNITGQIWRVANRKKWD